MPDISAGRISLIIITAVLGGLVFPYLLYLMEKKGFKWRSLLMKTVSSLTFVFLGCICGINTLLKGMLYDDLNYLNVFVRLFILGEILGAVGDIVINLGPWFPKSRLPLIFGGAFFLAGHVIFTVALTHVISGSLLPAILISLALFLVTEGLLLKLTETDNVMRLMITAYMVTVSVFAGFSLGALISAPSLGRAILSLGALVFLFSDFDLMLQCFGKSRKRWMFYCMYVYYPAQIISALSLLFFV